MRSIAIALSALLALAAGGQAAQSDPPQPSIPPDVKLKVRTKGGQTTFQLGEVIPLELEFTSTAPKKYRLDMATYDRSGRLGEDSFAVKPDSGWDDPLFLYFHAYQGFIGGGLRGSATLSAEPTLVTRELNEWVRFQTPGEYRVTVASTRVSKLDGQPNATWLSVISNELSLTIVPAAPKWQQETLRHAVEVLDASADEGLVASGQTNPRADAMKVLRYLGTPAAARELARRLNEPGCSSDCRFGLIGSPARAAGLDEMRRLLVDPEFPVDSSFLSTMSVAGLTSDSGDLPAQRQQLETAFRQELASALGAKRGPALAVSVNTIVEGAAISSHELTAQLIANFEQLPMQKQAELLRYRWKALDQRAMLPLLAKVAQRYRDAAVLNETSVWEFNNASGAALGHWYELDPAAARPAIVREIVRPRPRFNATVLGILPDGELPEVEQALAEHLRQPDTDGNGNLASLILRYASQAIEPQVVAYLDEHLGKMACAVQEPLLAYLLKVDPVAATPRLEKAMAARGEGFTACNHSLLLEVGKLHNDPVLEDIAIHRLDDADAQVVGNAAAYLGKFGSSAAEAALWRRLIAWSEHWAGREAELRQIPGENMDGIWEANAGTNMVQALATGQGWLADETKLRRLIQLSLEGWQRQNAEQWLRLWQARPLAIEFIAMGEGAFQMAQYQATSLQAAKDKLLQFPAGTAFHWRAGATQEGAEKAFQELSSFAAKHDMKIAKNLQPAPAAVP